MKAPSRKTIFTVSVALLVMAISCVLIIPSTKNSDLPVYQGKNVRQWFYGEDGHPGRQKTINAAKIAFRNMQTNCVPYLMGRLKTSDTLWDKVYAKVYPKLPKNLQQKLNAPVDSLYVHFIAVIHLRALPHSYLDPYAIELMKLLQPSIINRKHGDGAYQLAKRIATRMDDVELKTSFFSGMLNDPDFKFRLEAAILLSKVDSTQKNGIPVLLNAITNQYEVDSIFSRGIPMNILENMRIQKQQDALDALARISPKLAEQYPIEELQP